jgi:hypothetical protein
VLKSDAPEKYRTEEIIVEEVLPKTVSVKDKPTTVSPAKDTIVDKKRIRQEQPEVKDTTTPVSEKDGTSVPEIISINKVKPSEKKQDTKFKSDEIIGTVQETQALKVTEKDQPSMVVISKSKTEVKKKIKPETTLRKESVTDIDLRPKMSVQDVEYETSEIYQEYEETTTEQMESDAEAGLSKASQSPLEEEMSTQRADMMKEKEVHVFEDAVDTKPPTSKPEEKKRIYPKPSSRGIETKCTIQPLSFTILSISPLHIWVWV